MGGVMLASGAVLGLVSSWGALFCCGSKDRAEKLRSGALMRSWPTAIHPAIRGYALFTGDG